MKKRTRIFTTIALLACLYANAQTGLYKSAADYSNNNLAYESPCNSNNQQHIKLNDFWSNKATVTVVNDGKKTDIRKADLYGYRNCKNEAYRFYKDAAYKIEEAGGLYIYSKDEATGKGKNFNVVKVYYFSVLPDSNLMPLAPAYLKLAYRNNEKFLKLLAESMAGDNAAAYDKAHHMFMVNYVFMELMKH